MLGELLLLTGIVLISLAFYKWATLNHDYFKKRNIKHMKPTFLLGNLGRQLFQKTATELAQYLYQSFPNEPIYGLFDFRTPQYVLRDLEIIKQITAKDFDHFEDHRGFIDENADKMFGNSLIFMKGEKWRQMRATLSPAFTGSKMRQMFGLVADCADDIVKHFLKRTKNGEKINIEMKEFFSKYANDVIATCAFGLKINSFDDPENEFYLNGKTMMSFGGKLQFAKVLLMKQLPAVAKALDISLTGGAIGSAFRTTILDTMKIRSERNIFRPDMINIMMQIREGTLQYQWDEKKNDQDGFATVEESDVGKVAINHKWNDDEIVAQCFLFFVAGFDTSSTLLMFASYELALNPDIQQTLFEEIVDMDKKLDRKRINYDTLQKMKYLDQVVCETLRKWPPFTHLDRICVKDHVINVPNQKMELKIEKGVPFLVSIYGLQHDAQYFPEPDKFDPERFSDENKHKIVAGSYLPFGIGPRNCIGSRFALMEIKAILYYLLLNFSFEPNERTEIPLKLKKSSFAPLPENGLHLELRPRNKD